MTRLLHVHSGNMFGGVETMLLTLAQHGSIVRSDFALCFEGRFGRELREAGTEPVQLGEVQVSRPASLWRARRALARLLSGTPAWEAVVCHSPWAHAIFGPVARSAGVPLLFWMHDLVDGRHWLQRWARQTPPDLVICNSRFTATTLPHLFPESPAEVLYCPVDPRATSPSSSRRGSLRASLATERDAVVIIQVSRMEEWKGHLLHLQALAQLRDLPDWACWMVGGGQRPQEVAYLERLKSEASALGIADRVHFLGQRSDVPDLLGAADIHCQPNTGAEPFGITFVEALAAGLPVVTTDLGGAREIVDDSCGRLVPRNDAPALAQALRELVVSPQTRAKLGEAGPARARALCDPKMQLQRLSSLLTGVVTDVRR